VATRDELTTEWRERGAREGREFAVLTDTLSRGTFDLTTSEHKAVKGLHGSANLRDNMTTLEVALTTLAEATSTAIHQANERHGMGELRRDAQGAGDIAGAARQQIEEATRQPVVSSENAKQLQHGRRDELQPRLQLVDALDGGEDG
jgi:hypothetical protein